MDEIHIDDDEEAIIIGKDELARFKSFKTCPDCKKSWLALALSFKSGIGMRKDVVCMFCGWRKEITNYGNW